MNHIKIKEINIYHPEKLMNKEHYLKFYEEEGKDINSLLNVLGREDKYVIDSEDENTLTMGIKVAKQALKKSGLEGKDIDMIIFATQTPESLIPANSLQVHQAIQAGKQTLSMDLNTNCTGMLVAIEQASRTMLSNPRTNRALIIGSDELSLLCDTADPITYANFGDASCAVILEKTDENTGFIDAMYEVDTTNVKTLSFPVDGMTKFIKNQNSYGFIKEISSPRDTLPETFELFENLLKDNGYTIDDVDFIAPSQFVLQNIKRIQEYYNLDSEQLLFVGDKYGYTGGTSPLLAFYEGIKAGKVKRGDLILFYTIGTGHQIIAMLLKY